MVGRGTEKKDAMSNGIISKNKMMVNPYVIKKWVVVVAVEK